MRIEVSRRMPAVRLVVGLVCCLCFLGIPGAGAQDDGPGMRLQITGVAKDDFPEIAINLIATDARSQPLVDLEGLRLRENGVPVSDFEVETVPRGSDVFFVLDGTALSDMEDVTTGETALQRLQDSLVEFAGRFLDSAGNDTVTVLAAYGEDVEIVAQGVNNPAALVAAANGLETGSDYLVPPVNVLQQALMLASTGETTGRFQAVVLFSDGSTLSQTLMQPLVQQARVLNVPIFLAYMANELPDTELLSLSWLTRPTRGFAHAIHDATNIYHVLQANSSQPQLRYQSFLQRSGRYPLSVSLGDALADTVLDLQLTAPEVVIDLEEHTIRRAGTASDTPLRALQPTMFSLPVSISWPDGIPRRLVAATLTVNGQPQDAAVIGGPDSLNFEWSVADLDAGDYFATVQVTDSLGIQASSEPYPITIIVERPEPLPTPSAVPSPTPAPLIPSLPDEGIQVDLDSRLLLAAGFFAALFLLLVRRRRLRGESTENEPEQPLEVVALVQPSTAQLIPIDEAGAKPLVITGESVTIGREEDEVDIVLSHPTISPLHARIRFQENSYWLYDEGSRFGTMLNFERLGLAPKRLSDGDEVHFGRVSMRFRQL